MLFAHPIVSDSAALRRFEQHDYAKDITEHGRGGLWLHVIRTETIDIFFDEPVSTSTERTNERSLLFFDEILRLIESLVIVQSLNSIAILLYDKKD